MTHGRKTLAPRRRRTTAAAAAGALPLDREVKARIDRDLHQRLQEAAKRDDRSEAAIIRRALRAYLGEGAPR